MSFASLPLNSSPHTYSCDLHHPTIPHTTSHIFRWSGALPTQRRAHGGQRKEEERGEKERESERDASEEVRGLPHVDTQTTREEVLTPSHLTLRAWSSIAAATWIGVPCALSMRKPWNTLAIAWMYARMRAHSHGDSDSRRPYLRT
jgi:hypothetical protein